MSTRPNTSPPQTPLGHRGPRITGRAVFLGALTIFFSFCYIVYVGQGMRVGSYVHSQFPMAVFMPFVLWLFANMALKRLWPQRALRQGELVTILSMLWIVGTIPQLGWMNYWILTLAGPTYFATPANQWAETFFALMPWHVFPESTSRVIDSFWYGLAAGQDLPWDGWVQPLAQWLGVSLGMVAFGFCLMVIFQRQWVDAEKLTFPLAQMPLDLTQGFDGPRAVPDIFRSRPFWIGFTLVFLPILYNIITYFTPGLPPVEFYWKFYELPLGPELPTLFFRIMPLVLAVTYLCPVDILGSLVFFHLLAVLKQGFMQRTGFSVGLSGQQINAREILYLESYGALVFIGVWSIWLARRHLRQVWHQVRSGQGDPREVTLYRLAIAGLVLSTVWVVGWAVALGMSPGIALATFALMALTYFVTIKLIAATGFAYLLPNKPHIKGESFIVDLVGTTYLSSQSLVAFKIFTSNIFFGTFRIPAWPAIAHHLRFFSLRQQPRWVTATVFVAFPIGFLTAAGATLALAYQQGGILFTGGRTDLYSDSFGDIARKLDHPTEPDPGKWGIWLLGWFEAGLIAFLRGRYYWFTLHPIGLAFQYTFGTWIYWFNLFLVWIVKMVLLRYGGVRLYRAGKPFFYGLAIGYVVGVTLSVAVDLVWFPAEGHRTHGW